VLSGIPSKNPAMRISRVFLWYIGLVEKLTKCLINIRFHSKKALRPAALNRSDASRPRAPAEALEIVNGASMPLLILGGMVDSPQAEVEVRFFGAFHTSFMGHPLHQRNRKKVNALLAYILYSPQGAHLEKLLERFWGETRPDCARNALNVTLCAARKSFRAIDPDAEVIVFERGRYRLNPKVSIWSDVAQFHNQIILGEAYDRQGQPEMALAAFNQAIALYQGDFMDDTLDEEWFEMERTHYKEKYLHLLEWLGRYHFNKQDHVAAVNIDEKILKIDPLLEDAHARIIQSYLNMGFFQIASHRLKLCEEAFATAGLPLPEKCKQMNLWMRRGKKASSTITYC
jgi:DNA-binding SARP family transcriptional activator